jgi:hypothetical protein
MTDYTLSNEQKKRLTEFLGKKYDTREGWYGNFSKNPTFTTPQDAYDLAKKLAEMGISRNIDFKNFITKIWRRDDEVLSLEMWLLTNPARFSYLVNSYLEAG